MFCLILYTEHAQLSDIVKTSTSQARLPYYCAAATLVVSIFPGMARPQLNEAKTGTTPPSQSDRNNEREREIVTPWLTSVRLPAAQG